MDIDGGYRFGKLSLSMYDTYKTEAWFCRVVTSVYGCCLPYKDHIAACVPPLMEAYRRGLASGDYDMAIVSGV
jgi:predicted ATPase